jgi:hypothetical protein
MSEIETETEVGRLTEVGGGGERVDVKDAVRFL